METNKRQSTWREKKITLKPGLNEITFSDTKPNHIQINNLGAGDCYLGISLIPSTTIYDKMVKGYGEVLYARDTGITRCQIHNAGTNPNDIILVSFEADFTPAAISGGSVTISGDGGGGTGGDVTIKGHSVPLPAGANHIGHVTVDTMPSQTFVLDELPPGINHIGSVDVDSLPPLSAGTSHIGSVNVDNAVSISTMPQVVISSMPPVELTNDPVKQSHEFFETTVTDTIFTYDMATTGRSVSKIVFLSNDSLESDLYITFDNDVVSTTPGNGANSVIRLKPGEALNDVHRKCVKVNCLRAVGKSGVVRFMGV